MLHNRPTAFLPRLTSRLALRGCPAPPGDKGSQAGVHLMAFFGSKSNSQRKTASESVSHAFFGSVPLRPALRCRTLPCSSPTLPSALSYAPTTASEPPTPLQIGRPRPPAPAVREICVAPCREVHVSSVVHVRNSDCNFATRVATQLRARLLRQCPPTRRHPSSTLVSLPKSSMRRGSRHLAAPRSRQCRSCRRSDIGRSADLLRRAV